MVFKVSIRTAGGSLTATIPRKLVKKLGIEQGDKMFVKETKKGILFCYEDPAAPKQISEKSKEA